MFNLVYSSNPDLKKWKIFSNFETTQHIILAHIFGAKCESAIFVTNSDVVYALGKNYFGCLGIEDLENIDEPHKIFELTHEEVLGISTGLCHGLAYTTKGDLFSWGFNGKGELGDGTTVNRARPAKVKIGENENFINVSAGSSFSMALSSYNEVWLWGKLLPGNRSAIPTKVNFANVEKIIYITSGWSHAVALSECGKVFTWGSGQCGQLGHGNTTAFPTPKQVEQFNHSKIFKVACGKAANIAINELGDIYTWGYNQDGCLSVDISKDMILLPVKVQLRESLTDIAASIYHQIFAAINQQSGNVFIWGFYEDVVKYLRPISLPCHTLFDAFCDLATPMTVKENKQDDFQDNTNENLTDADFVSVKDLDFKLSDEKAITERYLPPEMFNNKEMCDLIIKLSDCDIYAHKVILNYFSKHFRKMFQEQWKENSMETLDMTNYNSTAYKAYIKFVYTGIMEENKAIDMFDLYLISREYREESLAAECLIHLSQVVSVDNVAALFASAWRNKCQEMIDMCIKESAKNFDDVILTKGFADFTNEERLSFCQLTATERKNYLQGSHLSN